MTKKHFKALAKALHSVQPFGPGRKDQWLWDCRVVADVCQEANPKFDWNKFLEACQGQKSEP